jgi:uncharacterized protein YcaQ
MRSETGSLSLAGARRVAVTAQMLSSPRPRSILDVVEGLGSIQMDPTRAVARTEHLVLWSRLGPRFRVQELERLLWQDRSLFEYRAFIVPVSQLAVHRATMRRYPSTDVTRHAYVRRYLRENRGFRRYVLDRLRDEGPLPTRALDDRSAVGWRTGGWNDEGRNTGMMLEVLWAKGEVMIAGRDGPARLWDLAERRLPADGERLRPGEEARRLLDAQLRALGIARLNRFGFRFRLEIYVPKAKREYGYFVMPILHGDRLVGRIDPAFDRDANVLRVREVFAEPDAPRAAWPAIHRQLDDLAAWLGADAVEIGRLPRVWRSPTRR